MDVLKRMRTSRLAMLSFACAAIIVCTLALTGCAGLPVGDAQLKMLAPITMSFTTAAEKLGKKPSGEELDALVTKHFPGFKLDADLRELILKRKPLERNHAAYVVQNVLGRMVARQTGIYWGTGGHTSEPVLVGAVGPGADLFRAYQNNTDFGRNLHRLIDEP